MCTCVRAYTCMCVHVCGRDVLCSALRPQEQKDKMVTAKDVIYLKDSETTINGIRIWGSPWQPEFGGGHSMCLVGRSVCRSGS